MDNDRIGNVRSRGVLRRYKNGSALLLSTAKDTISLQEIIRDGETIISSGEKFEFGFFTPDGATPNKRYAGIWYHKLSSNSTRTVVWVANREKPVMNSRGCITIKEDGSLQILDEKGTMCWSTRIPPTDLPPTRIPPMNTSAKLLDSGNLILSGENDNLEPIWQSFLEESNTFLPGMEMDTSKVLRSWTSEHDPAPGKFMFKLDEDDHSRYEIRNGSAIYWRSTSFINGLPNSNEIPPRLAYLLSNISSTSKNHIKRNQTKILNPGNYSQPYLVDFNNTRLVIHPSGQIMFYNWSSEIKGWQPSWFEPSDNCSIYNICGAYGICNSSSTPVCRCLEGFKPKFMDDWNSGQFSEGCMRTQGCKDNKFLGLKVIKVENLTTIFGAANTIDGCREECLSKCTCNGFYLETDPAARLDMGNATCRIWMDEDLKDLQEDVAIQSQLICVRVANSDLHALGPSPALQNEKPPSPSQNEKPSSSILVVTIAIGVIIFSCAVVCMIYARRRRLAKRKAYRESIQESSTAQLDRDEKNASSLIDPSKLGEDQKGIDVPFFPFESVVAATENFSDTNKLGQGGFGPVYKGRLQGGQEIAVKRLSRSSVQGMDEFKNEVLLIAKLQHRNLVRLLGYTIKGDEKMLLYEYMPNKSLDSFIFDQSRCLLVNWEMRFNIIMGISRGLLYLHQDSRLRIIHRDLKTSNILLDEDMNPKISDFGIARIVGGNQTEASTNRVVGTYGYMSPEYALDGFFSVKSDVFSFGVVLLEIISGKKNTGFYQSEHSLSLLGYAWELWKENKVLDFVDKSLHESCNVFEVSKCINVGLLCVQEDADDRPTMSNVIFLLRSDTATPPTPNQPAYFARKCPSSSTSSSKPELYSTNELTISVQEGSSALLLSTAKDTISLKEIIRDGEIIISSGEKFEFGFFTPDGATPNKRYAGIWYHKLSSNSTKTVVWVANRAKPVMNFRGYITIKEDGNLQILDEKGIRYWTTEIPLMNTSAKLLDSGNLILSGDNDNHEPIWQSFSVESNTFLPGMEMDTSKVLRSWTSEDDPAPGKFEFKLADDHSRYEIMNGSAIYWRSASLINGPSNSNEIPPRFVYFLSNFSSTSKNHIKRSQTKILNPGDYSQPYLVDFNNTRLVIHPSGQIMFYNWSSEIKGWNPSWFGPSNNCSIYNICGAYGICNSSSTPVCQCLKGFKPKFMEDWNSGQFSEGCMRTQGCKNNGFLDLKVIKVENPTTKFDANTIDGCRRECLSQCKCNGFTFETEPAKRLCKGDTTCRMWMDEDLKDLEEDVSSQSQLIFVRVAYFDLEPTCNSSKNCEEWPRSTCMPSSTWNGMKRCICNPNHPWDPSTRNCTQAPKPIHPSPKEKPSSSILAVTIAIGVIIFSCAVVCMIYLRRRRLAKRKAYQESIQEISTSHFDQDEKNDSSFIYPSKLAEDQKGIDVPFFPFESVVAATENFCDTNKLGQGGFGPVYKGRLQGGQEIAVKRLSRSSVQGIDEFKNEVLLIAKLQHRNLVRLLGYTIKGDEKMLLYEYMPNKSLDSFILDQLRCLLVNWEMRFNIIMGISRGLLYLHQDSRLRIIHRDLKTSNILLDEDMNPKISDFGIARIVGGKQTEASTNRVVGTYGYMSPEYALDGLFSVKSDVFSFGVVLLEIVSGKKNTGFYQSEDSLSLLGYAWELWNENKVLHFVDKSLYESCNVFEVSKCINVGLLCVQEDADDQPTMSNVIFMLCSDTATLPTPKQPAYIARKCPSSSTSSSRPELNSTNELTVSVQEGR
ncbi:hypothetical protein NE237_019456 [Protea cynaroides]|uniref:Uncharacterized protein n=1 Tax=Protea cynaroides TaxID=273540 RepID=A0A9Q0KBV6_9MAGN|nr:hypothetical protein NE237_019456 [Protea cynaroides]